MSGPDLEDPRRRTGAAGPSPMRRPPQLRAGGDEHRHASWLELFFDLVFVAVVFQVGEALAEHHDAAGFFEFVGVFTIVAWSWMCFTYFGNRFDTDDVPQRILISLAMLAVAGLGIAVGDASGSWSERFALAQVAVHLVLLALYARARLHVPDARASIDRYLVGFGLGALVWLASAMVDTPLRYVLWGAALAIEVATPLLSWGVLARLPVDREHLRERFGLFTIIVLGEAVLAVVIGTQDARWAAPAISTTMAGFLGVLALWWVYFDEQSAASLRGGRWAFVVAYGHLPLWLGATAYGIGVKLAIEHAEGAAEDPGIRWALAGGAALLLVAIGAFHVASANREPAVLSISRGMCIVALIALAATGSALQIPTLTVLVVLVAGISLAIEAVSVREAGGHVWALAAAAVQPPEPPFRPPVPSALPPD